MMDQKQAIALLKCAERIANALESIDKKLSELNDNVDSMATEVGEMKAVIDSKGEK
jgi:hypothetical protein